MESGLIHAAGDVYTVYRDPRRDEWQTRIAPALKKIPLKQFERVTGKSRRLPIDARTGRADRIDGIRSCSHQLPEGWACSEFSVLNRRLRGSRLSSPL